MGMVLHAPRLCCHLKQMELLHRLWGWHQCRRALRSQLMAAEAHLAGKASRRLLACFRLPVCRWALLVVCLLAVGTTIPLALTLVEMPTQLLLGLQGQLRVTATMVLMLQQLLPVLARRPIGLTPGCSTGAASGLPLV